MELYTTSKFNKDVTTIERPILFFIGMEIIFPLFSAISAPSLIVFAVRICLLLISVSIIINNAPRLFTKVPINIYMIWMFYVVIKNLLLGYGEWTSPVQMMSAIIPSSFVVVASYYGYQKDEDRTINACLIAIYIYILYAFISVGGGAKGGMEAERLGSDTLNANSIGIRAGLAFIFVISKFLRKKIGVLSMISLLIFPMIMIVLSGSRTGLGIMVITLLVFLLRKKTSVASYFSKISFVLFFVIAILYILNNTDIGTRILDTTNQSENLDYLYTGTQWDLLGDRGYLFYIATPHISDNFWFGIGSNNFLSTIPGALWVLHSEYLIQLLECGIFATLLYFYVYLWIYKYTVKISTYDVIRHDMKVLSILLIIVLLFACLVTRVSYYGIYSCIIGYLIFNVYKYSSKK